MSDDLPRCISLSFKKEAVQLLEIIEKDRGKVKRSTHISDILEQYYGVGDYSGQQPLKERKQAKGWKPQTSKRKEK